MGSSELARDSFHALLNKNTVRPFSDWGLQTKMPSAKFFRIGERDTDGRINSRNFECRSSKDKCPVVRPAIPCMWALILQNVFRRYQKLGLMTMRDFSLAISSRVNRMNAPNSPNSAAFKEAYGRLKAYFLAPALVDEGGTKIFRADVGLEHSQEDDPLPQGQRDWRQ